MLAATAEQAGDRGVAAALEEGRLAPADKLPGRHDAGPAGGAHGGLDHADAAGGRPPEGHPVDWTTDGPGLGGVVGYGHHETVAAPVLDPGRPPGAPGGAEDPHPLLDLRPRARPPRPHLPLSPPPHQPTHRPIPP